MPNFSPLAGLEVAENFSDGGVGGFQVATMSNLNVSCFRVTLSWGELPLGFDNKNKNNSNKT